MHAWAELDGEVASVWCGVLRQLGVHKSAISLAEGGPPDASSRSLKRMLTEEGADEKDDRAQEMRQDRVETWKSAQAARNKYATVTHADVKSRQDIQAWFERHRGAHRFVGKAGESHRAFVLSGDTFGQEGSEPWKATSEKNKDQLSMVLEFMYCQTGPFGAILFSTAGIWRAAPSWRPHRSR